MCTENLNPNVLTMKSAQYGARIYDTGSLNLARDRRIFVQRPMRSHAVVIVRIVFQNPTQMFLVQDNDVVQTLAPDRSDQPFSISIVKSSQLHSYRLIGRKPSWLRMSFTPSTVVSSGS